jgi:hypothetical protein
MGKAYEAVYAAPTGEDVPVTILTYLKRTSAWGSTIEVTAVPLQDGPEPLKANRAFTAPSTRFIGFKEQR